MRVDDLVNRARAAATSSTGDAARYALARLAGGMTHDVFVADDEPAVVMKVFRTSNANEPEHEWDALITLAGSGISPAPVHFERGEQPVVVMERVRGSPLATDELAASHAAAIGRAHHVVHGASSERQPDLPRAIRESVGSSLARDLGHAGRNRDDTARVIHRAWHAARSWVARFELDDLVAPERLTFSRGDPNLSNYLWTGDGLVLVDWENAGYNDPALELADMAEHPSARGLSDAFWDDVADATELTSSERTRVAHCRRAMACFWLVLIEARQRQGLPTTVNLEEQAQRTLSVLDP